MKRIFCPLCGTPLHRLQDGAYRCGTPPPATDAGCGGLFLFVNYEGSDGAGVGALIFSPEREVSSGPMLA